MFHRIHALLESTGAGASFHLQYVPSADNPADDPSRGIFPPQHLLLPPITLPDDLSHFLLDANLSNQHPRPTVFAPHQSADELVDAQDDNGWGDQLFQLRDFWRD